MLNHHWPQGRKPERVVIIGAAGFVGGAILRHLDAEGINCVGIGRAEVDLLDGAAAGKLADFLDASDTVIAASAIAPVKTPDMLKENITLISAVADAIQLQPVSHLVNIGSDAIYADSENPLTESSSREAGSLHGIMHFIREMMLGEAVGSAPFATIRPTLIYGKDDPHNGYGPNRFRRLAESEEGIVLFGEGEERRDHVWIEDVASLVTRMVLHRSEGVLNAATGKVVSFREAAEFIANLYDQPVEIVGSPRVGPMPHNGYRPFSPGGTERAFPDFKYTMPFDGFSKVYAEISGHH